MTRIITDPKQYEVWRSAINGGIYLRRYDRNGSFVFESVLAGRTIHITPDERRVNQEMSSSPDADPFMNGFLVPVRLLEDDKDAEVLALNPNSMSEDEMRLLLSDRRSLKNLTKAVSAVVNPMTMQRFLAVAQEPDVDATVRQMSVLQERLAEVTDSSVYSEVETVYSPDGRETFRTKPTEGSPAPSNPAVGRR